MAVRVMSEEKNDSITVTDVTKEDKSDVVENASDNQDETEKDDSNDSSSKELEGETKEKENPSENKYKDWPMRDIKEPHENDVLYGRGGGTNHHPGNKRYRKMVETRKLEYITSKRLDKPNVAIQIIDEWRSQDPPGRFLKQDEATGLWHDVGPKKAREKTSQALREKAPQLKQENKKKTAYIENNRETYIEPENFYNNESPNQRVVSFPQEDARGTTKPTRKISRAVLLRDHSLGHDVVKSGEELTLEGFSWQKPVEVITGNNNNFSLGRENSLAKNPLTQTNVAEPAKIDYFSKEVFTFYQYGRRQGNDYERRYSGSRNSFQSEDRRSSFSNPQRGIHRRSSSSENLASSHDYQTNIYQSWSHGQEDEYLQQNNNIHPSWDKQLGSFEPVRRSSSNSSYRRGQDYHNYPTNQRTYPGKGSPNNTDYYSPYRSSPPNRRTSDASATSTQQMLPPAPVPMRSSSTNSNHHYPVERTSPPNYRPHFQPVNHPYTAQTQHMPPPQSVPPRGTYEDVHNYSRSTHHPDPQYNSFNTESRKNRRSPDQIRSPSHLIRPSTIKRATSNQNEEAETKKETKLIKRPGLNRQHSITAYNMKVAQREKEMNAGNISNSSDERRQLLGRQHSLAANRLSVNDSFLDEPISKTIFSNDDKDKVIDDDTEDLEPLQTKVDPFGFTESDLKEDVLEEDLRHISQGTQEIDLGESSSLKLDRPARISGKKRLTTIELIDEIVASSGDDIFEGIVEVE